MKRVVLLFLTLFAVPVGAQLGDSKQAESLGQEQAVQEKAPLDVSAIRKRVSVGVPKQAGSLQDAAQAPGTRASVPESSTPSKRAPKRPNAKKRAADQIEHPETYQEKKQRVDEKIARERAQRVPTMLPAGDGQEERGELEKRSKAQELVERAMRYFNEHSLEEACNAFTLTREFVVGELSIFLIDTDGVYLADGSESTFLWHNLYNMRDRFGFLVIQGLIDVAKKGGGWITYEWRNEAKISYVKLVEKGGKSYVIGSGFYPQSRAEEVVSMVRGAVAWFEKVKDEGRPPAEAFGDMDYPLGRFVDGNTYIFAYDDRGTLVAFGDMPTYVGFNHIDIKDEDGKPYVREMLDRFKKGETEAWFEIKQNRAKRRIFAKRVFDAEEKMYIIGSGYYPDINKDVVVDLVRRGYEFMKKSGKSQAVEAFSSRIDNDFRVGGVYLIVYDMHGKVMADGRDPGLIGQNFYNTQDEGGSYYVRNFIAEAKRGGGWVDVRMNNSIWSVYVEDVDLGVEKMVLCAGIYPVTRRETMELTTKSAVSFLNANDEATAFHAFSDRKGRFVRGDLEVLVVNSLGYCYVYGIDLDVVWRNILNAKDDDGRPFIKLIINSAQQGPGIVKYRLNGATKEAYAQMVKKGDKTYIVASSSYI